MGKRILGIGKYEISWTKGWMSVRRVREERRISLVEEIEGIGEKDIN